METKTKIILIGQIVLLSLLGDFASAAPLGTAFTYQGKLTDNSAPAQGIYDLRFTVYDSASGGSPIAGPQTNSAVAVKDGLFTVRLDFGQAVFAGEARWLEIAARTNGAGAFATFPARQAITPAPYALFATTAGAAVTAGSASVADSAHSVASNAVTSASIAAGQVVKTLNGLTDGVLLAAGSNMALATNGNTLTLSAAGAGGSGGWSTSGNAGTSPATNFLGTTDNRPLELRVNGQRALWLVPTTNSPNVIAGATNNIVDEGIIGATIAGGGSPSSAAHYGAPLPQQVSASFTTIGGGLGNIVEGYGSTVSGGEQNWIRSWTPDCAGSTIAGGGGNEVGSHAGSVGGGVGNGVMGNMAVIAGGLQNDIGIEGHLSAIGGGFFNLIRTNGDFTRAGVITNAQAAYVGGGISNLAVGVVSTISGGCANTNAANFSVVGGGYFNAIQRESSDSFLGGGNGNSIQTNAGGSVLGGGEGNSIQPNAWGSFLGGGLNNSIQTYANDSFLGAGLNNSIQTAADHSALGGGEGNSIQPNAVYSFLGGGVSNSIKLNAQYSVLSGGGCNTAGATGSTVAGGYGNTAAGSLSAIGGGYTNTANGVRSTVPGGYLNVAGGDYSFAAGRRAKAMAYGDFVWADSTDADFSTYVPDQFAIRAAGGVYIQSDRGIALNAVNRPLITRGWDAFDGTAPPEKLGLGRWGLFMEPFNLVIGIPGDDTPGRNFQVGKYARDGSWLGLMLVDQTGMVQARLFNPTSDRAAKENFTAIDSREVLDKVARLPLTQWNFKQDRTVRHLGPMAQDFYAAFGLGTDDKHIATVDADGVALVAIQGLNQKLEQVVRDKDAKIAALEKRLAALEQLVVRQTQEVNGGGL